MCMGVTVRIKTATSIFAAKICGIYETMYCRLMKN